MGGTIMGANRASSVTNRYSQTHDIANLLIGGPGVYPTASSVNSTFHLHALAMMSAKYAIEEWSGIV